RADQGLERDQVGVRILESDVDQRVVKRGDALVRRRIAEVAADRGDAQMEERAVLFRRAVEGGHGVARPDERRRNGAADVSRPARQEHAHPLDRPPDARKVMGGQGRAAMAGSSSTFTQPGWRRSNALYASMAPVRGSCWVRIAAGSMLPLRMRRSSLGMNRR